MPWRGPEHEGDFPSLGWALVDWWQEYLRVPSGALYGQPLVLTDEQVDFFVRFYALRPDGRRVYRRASRRGAKGKGKSPEAAAWVLGEFCGPTMFDGWDANGEPVGRARDFPWLQVIAVSEEQTGNLYLAMREMLAESGLIDEYSIDLGKTKVEFAKGHRPGLIEPVSSSAGAREGQPITGAALEETHLWFPSRGGQRLAAVARRNLAKTGGTSLEVTNAPALGEGAVAEDTLAAANKAQSGLLYDSVEAPWVEDPKDPANKAAVMDALRIAYGDAAMERGGWVDLERIYEEVMDASVTVSEVRRFYFNQAVKSENRAFDPTQWAQRADRSREITGPVLLAFDGARARDCVALTGWTIDEVPHHFGVKVWRRPDTADDGWQYDRDDVLGTIEWALDHYDVELFAFDSSWHEWDTVYDAWTAQHGEAKPEKGTGLMVPFATASGQRMEAAIVRVIEDMRVARSFTHDGDLVVTEHVENAVLTRNRSGWLSLAKEKDSLKIDAAVTMVFGYSLIQTARLMHDNRRPVYRGPMVAFR